MRGKNCLFWVAFFVGFNGWAQNENYAGLTTFIQKKNPSYFGFNNLNKIGVLYNSIEIGQNNVMETQYAFAALSFEELNFSLGIELNSFTIEKSGLALNDFLFTYAYHLRVTNNTYLLPSVRLGIANSQLDTQNVIFEDQLNSVTGFINSESIDPLSDLQGATRYFHMAASFLVHNEEYLIGVSFQNLNQPNASFNKEVSRELPISYQLVGGYEWSLNPYDNNFWPASSYLFFFSSLDFFNQNLYATTAQEVLIGPLTFGVSQRISRTPSRIALNNLGFSFRIALENFDFGLFYQLPLQNTLIHAPKIFEVQLTFNFSKFRRNNKGNYKRLQTDNYF